MGIAPFGLAIAPDGRYLYVACALSHLVYGFHIDPDGDLDPVPGSPVPAPKTPEGLAVTPDGRGLFVTQRRDPAGVSPDDDGLWTFSIGTDGALTVVERRSDTATGPGVTTTPDGRYLYVSNFFANTVSAFETDTLRQLDGSPATTGTSAMAPHCRTAAPGPATSTATQAATGSPSWSPTTRAAPAPSSSPAVPPCAPGAGRPDHTPGRGDWLTLPTGHRRSVRVQFRGVDEVQVDELGERRRDRFWFGHIQDGDRMGSVGGLV